MTTGNKGDWSEVYTFLKILDDRKLFFADKDLNFIENQSYPVIGIIREEAKTETKYYELIDEDQIAVSNLKNESLGFVDSSKIKSYIRLILETLSKKRLGRAFSVPNTENLLSDLKCTQIKAGSKDKADITVRVKEIGSPMENDLGFSIKSMLGGAATLINSSGATNFIYKISNFSGNVDEINSIETSSKIKDRITAIKNAGGEIVFDSLSNKKFENNLTKIDSNFTYILAAALENYFEGKGNKISELPLLLEKDENLKNKYHFDASYFEFKIKLFLRAAALGMVPNKEWDGLNKATGGCLIVKQNGEVACYRMFDFDALQEYLFRNTKFDTPSSTRHKFGTIYEKDGDLFINLNLQIRFLK